MSAVLRTINRSIPHRSRALATAANSNPTARPKFSQDLENGPGLDDFIAGDVPDRIVLGNTTG
jgi:lipoic acid synthetase